MADRKYYVLCEQNCKFESLTKEQILTAISQAVETGSVGDCDVGFITTIKTINGQPLKFFVGTQSEYELLSADQKQNLFALITNDTTKEGITAAINELRTSHEALSESLADGSFKVAEATHATNADEATHATNADEATHATNADNATEANHAANASNAGNATVAEKLKTTKFINHVQLYGENTSLTTTFYAYVTFLTDVQIVAWSYSNFKTQFMASIRENLFIQATGAVSVGDTVKPIIALGHAGGYMAARFADNEFSQLVIEEVEGYPNSGYGISNLSGVTGISIPLTEYEEWIE